MASTSRAGRQPTVSFLLLASATVLVAAALAVRMQDPGRATNLGPNGLPAGSTESMIPLPGDTFAGTILSATASPLSASAAIDLARENPSRLVGEAPLVRFMHVRDSSPESVLADFIGWVILSPDVYVPIYGGHDAPIVRPAISYGWVFVDLDGTVVAAIAISYANAADAPQLPSQ